jgi:hypothetical protein
VPPEHLGKKATITYILQKRDDWVRSPQLGLVVLLFSGWLLFLGVAQIEGGAEYRAKQQKLHIAAMAKKALEGQMTEFHTADFVLKYPSSWTKMDKLDKETIFGAEAPGNSAFIIIAKDPISEGYNANDVCDAVVEALKKDLGKKMDLVSRKSTNLGSVKASRVTIVQEVGKGEKDSKKLHQTMTVFLVNNTSYTVGFTTQAYFAEQFAKVHSHVVDSIQIKKPAK